MKMLERYPEIQKLSLEEKLQLVDELWAEMEGDRDTFEMSPELAAELDRRIAEYERNPSTGSTWEEVRARLHARSGKRAV